MRKYAQCGPRLTIEIFGFESWLILRDNFLFNSQIKIWSKFHVKPDKMMSFGDQGT